jgi:hypothetical protein
MPVILMRGLEERVNGCAQVRKPFDIGYLLKLVNLMLVSETGMSVPEV